MSQQTTLPTDEFSVRRRELTDNPGAFHAASRIDVADLLGNLVTWNVDTFSVDGGEEVFLQRTTAEGGLRLLLPKAVMAALRRHQAANERRARRRGARQALETKRARGIDPAAGLRTRLKAVRG